MARASESWVGYASWLTFRRHAGETLRDAVARTIREAIREGVLRPGMRLPGSRVLARELGLSRGVISEAYAQLEQQGCVITRVRTAPEVASIPTSPPSFRSPPVLFPTAVARFDFTPTTPDVSLFPVRDWVRVYSRAARRSPVSALDYRAPQGEPVLRHALADHLGRTRGALVDPDQIIVVQGTAQAIDLLLRVCQEQDRTRIAVENPSHTTQHERIRSAGLDLLVLNVDAEGALCPSEDADLVLLTPAHQFPTGVVLSGERRRRLIEWAIEREAWLVEDDYDSEFRYDREAARALQGLAPDKVVLVGTVSKTLAPALRLGWIAAPLDLVERLVVAKRLADDFTPALDQLALAELLSTGAYDRYVRKTRAAYRRRRDELLAALAEYLPQLAVEGVAAGVHLMARLGPDADDETLAGAARAQGVHVEPLSRFYIDAPLARGLVLGYGRLHESAIRPAVRALAHAIAGQIGSQGRGHRGRAA